MPNHRFDPLPEKHTEKELLIGLCAILLVAGSQVGMVYLSALYFVKGRLYGGTLTLELVFGVISVIIFVLYIIKNGWRKIRSLPMLFLLFFVLAAMFAELINVINAGKELQAHIFTLSIGIYFSALIGYEYGRILVQKKNGIGFYKLLISIYLFWYLSLIVFYFMGYLGFYDQLSGTSAMRLSFKGGYTATEIPVYIGLHAPVIYYVLVSKNSSRVFRLLSLFLLFMGVVVALGSLSVGVVAGALALGVVFYWAHKGLSSLRFISLAVFFLIVYYFTIFVDFQSDVVDSVLFKIDRFLMGGSGRVLFYEHLSKIIYETPLGIGKGEFVKINFYSWDGKGVYPHNNILGIGAELGWGALLFYALFILSSIKRFSEALTAKVNGRFSREMRLLIAIGFSVFLFQQVRGNLHDTWAFKEMYFWVGMSLALTARRYPIVETEMQVRSKL